MKTLFFTATGNSLHVAKSFGGETVSIPSMIKQGVYEFTDDKIGIVFPIYSNKVPQHVENFLIKAKFNCDYLFAVMTYGIFAAAAPKHLLDIAAKAEHNFDYINTIKMVDNWLPGFKMDSQVKSEDKKRVEEHLSAIVADVNYSKEWMIKTNAFTRLWTANMVKGATKPNRKENLMGGSIGNGIKNFVSVEGCIGCGTCAKVCPVDNITVDKERKTITFGGNCLSCFACVHNCPTTAIHLKGERSSARYRNKNVSLKEIVEANNR